MPVFSHKQQFEIALKEQEKPVDFGKEFFESEAIKQEYATRYLESIGADTTLENMQMVWANLPLGKCKNTMAWKARGWAKDCLYIQPNPKKKPGGSKVAKQTGQAETTIRGLRKLGARLGKGMESETASQQIDRGHAEAKKRRANMGKVGRSCAVGGGANNAGEGRGSEPTQAHAAAHAGGRHERMQMFEDAKQKHVYPFNVANDRANDGCDDTGPSQLQQQIDALAKRGAAAASLRAGSDSSSGSQQGRRHENDLLIALEELRRPLRVTMKDIDELQRLFAASIPYKLLEQQGGGQGGTVSAKQKRALEDLLRCPAMNRLLGLCCHYLYFTVLRRHSDELAKTVARAKAEREEEAAREQEKEKETRWAGRRQEPAMYGGAGWTEGGETGQGGGGAAGAAGAAGAGAAGAPEGLTDTDRQAVFLAVMSSYAEIESQLKAGLYNAAMQLPLVLLSLRVAVESTFKQAFPAWFRIEAEAGSAGALARGQAKPGAGGVEQGRDMNGSYQTRVQTAQMAAAAAADSPIMATCQEVITRLFDPDKYGSHISQMGSTTEAVRIKNRVQHRAPDVRLRDRFHTTSATTQLLYPRPAQGKARKFIVENGGTEGGRGRVRQADQGASKDPSGTWCVRVLKCPRLVPA